MGTRRGGDVGCFSEFVSLELYAEVFDALGCLDKLEAFASSAWRARLNVGRMAPTSMDCRGTRGLWS